MARRVEATLVCDTEPVSVADALTLCRMPVRRNLRDEIDTVVIGSCGIEVLGTENGANSATNVPFFSVSSGSTGQATAYCIDPDDYESNYTAVWDSYLGCVLVAAGGSSDLLRVSADGRVAPLLHSATFLRQQRLRQQSDRVGLSGCREAAAAGGHAAEDDGQHDEDEAVSFTCVATGGAGSVWVIINGLQLFHLDVTSCRVGGSAGNDEDSRGGYATNGGGAAAAASTPLPTCRRLCSFSEPVTALAHEPHHRCLLVATGTELYAVPALGGTSAAVLPEAVAAAVAATAAAATMEPSGLRQKPRQQSPWAWDGEPRLLLGGVGDAEGRRLGPQRDGAAEVATLAGVVGLAACGRRGQWVVLEQVMAQCSRRRGVAPRSCVRRLQLPERVTWDSSGGAGEQGAAAAGGGGGAGAEAGGGSARISTLVTAEDAAWRSPLVLPGGVLAVLQDVGGGGGSGAGSSGGSSAAGGGLRGGRGGVGCEVVLLQLGLTPPAPPLTALAAAEVALAAAGGPVAVSGAGLRPRGLAADMGALLECCQPSPPIVLPEPVGAAITKKPAEPAIEPSVPAAAAASGSGSGQDDGSDGTADVWLVAAGGAVVAAHRGILAARCDYFRPLLTAGSGFAEDAYSVGGGGQSGSGLGGAGGGSGAGGGGSRRRLLSMQDARPDALMMVLRHVYTGHTDSLLPPPPPPLSSTAPIAAEPSLQLLSLPTLAPPDAGPASCEGTQQQQREQQQVQQQQQQQQQQQHLHDLEQQRHPHLYHRRRARRAAVRSAGVAEAPAAAGAAGMAAGCFSATDTGAIVANTSSSAPAPTAALDGCGDSTLAEHLELLWAVAALADQLLLPELSRAAGRALLQCVNGASGPATAAPAGNARRSSAAASAGSGAAAGTARQVTAAVASASGHAAALAGAAEALLRRADAVGFVELADELRRRGRPAGAPALPPKHLRPHPAEASAGGLQAGGWRQGGARAPTWGRGGGVCPDDVDMQLPGCVLLPMAGDGAGRRSQLPPGREELAGLEGLEGLLAVVGGEGDAEAAEAAGGREPGGGCSSGAARGVAVGQACDDGAGDAEVEGVGQVGEMQELKRRASSGGSGGGDGAFCMLEELARVSGDVLKGWRAGDVVASGVSIPAIAAAPSTSTAVVAPTPEVEGQADNVSDVRGASSPSPKRLRAR